MKLPFYGINMQGPIKLEIIKSVYKNENLSIECLDLKFIDNEYIIRTSEDNFCSLRWLLGRLTINSCLFWLHQKVFANSA